MYDGLFCGIGNIYGRCIGVMIIIREVLGFGRFEVCMCIMLCFGLIIVMWIYYYDNGMNYEIDIESNVENDFRKVWIINWISLIEYSIVFNILDFV